MRDYFQKHFSSNGIQDSSRILDGIDICISMEMNHRLSRNFTIDEI